MKQVTIHVRDGHKEYTVVAPTAEEAALAVEKAMDLMEGK